MKRTMMVLLAGIMSLMTCGLALTANDNKQGKWQGQRIEILNDELSLSPAQKDRVSESLKVEAESTMKEMQKIQEAVQAAREDADREIKSVLTSDQAQKYEQLQ